MHTNGNMMMTVKNPPAHWGVLYSLSHSFQFPAASVDSDEDATEHMASTDGPFEVKTLIGSAQNSYRQFIFIEFCEINAKTKFSEQRQGFVVYFVPGMAAKGFVRRYDSQRAM